MRPTRSSLAGCFALLLGGSLGPHPSRAELTDSGSHPPPEYTQVLPPALGSYFTDPVFGTSVRRVSRALYTANSFAGGPLTWIQPEYATMSAFNQDGSLFVLQHDGYLGLYLGEGEFLEDLPFTPVLIHAATEPRWSRTSPTLLYFIDTVAAEPTLMSYYVLAGTFETIREFPEYDQVSGHGESDLCFDGDHMVFAGDGEEIFVYTISTDTKGPVLATGGAFFDSLYLTPDDHVTVTWIDQGKDRFEGIELFDLDMVFLRQLTGYGGHMDVTRDVGGEEVLVWANAADPTPICNNGVVKVRMSDGARTCLLSLDFSLAFHVSCPDDAGFCVVGTYAPFDPDPSETWVPYANEILEVDLDGGEVRRLLHHRSRPFNTFNYQPRGSVSRDGRRLVLASNFGLQELIGAPTHYSDAYLVELDGIFLDGFESGDLGRWMGADGFVRDIPIFTDGFETGDTSRWSEAVP